MLFVGQIVTETLRYEKKSLLKEKARPCCSEDQQEDY